MGMALYLPAARTSRSNGANHATRRSENDGLLARKRSNSHPKGSESWQSPDSKAMVDQAYSIFDLAGSA
jgi:hypothetical protein